MANTHAVLPKVICLKVIANTVGLLFSPCYVTARMLGWYSCMLVTGWYRAPGVMSCPHLGPHLGCRALAPPNPASSPIHSRVGQNCGLEESSLEVFLEPCV